MAIYCHGWPSSRLEAALAPHVPMRLVAADRPGYGKSDPSPGTATLRDRAADIARLADHLGLVRFPVVGVSGGGPMAAACARFLTPRVSALTLISAVPPPEHITGGPLALLMRLGRWQALGRPAMVIARQLILSRHADTAVFSGLPASDRETMTPQRRAGLLAAMREGVRSSAAGALADAHIYGTPWGFQLEDIAVPTTIWQGTEDQLVPVHAASAYARIPGAIVNIAQGHGHYSLALDHIDAILAALLAQAGQDPGIRAYPG